MIINNLDLGAPSNPWAQPIVGQVVGSELIEGSETIVWPRGSIERKQTVNFGIQAWQAIGGASANTLTARKYLIKQVEELASNRDMQPCYIQWTATADPAAALNSSDLHDGWYIIDDFEPDYSRYIVSSFVSCRMTVTHVADAAPRRVAMAYAGGALSSNFSGGATNLLSLPLSSTATETFFTRVAAEGSLFCIASPSASPEQLILSSTISNIFKGGVHVYDTINTSSNPVPTSGGTFVHANWVEVFDTHHDFQGDCVLTNGLQLLIFQAAFGQLCTCYLWNTALAQANWQQYATLNYQDNSSNNAALRSYSLTRVGPEECSVSTTSSTSTNQAARVNVRLQRGRYEARVDLTPLTQANTNSNAINLGITNAIKFAYTSAVASDAQSPSFLGIPTDYGYVAGFSTNASFPMILGLLDQNEPTSGFANDNVILGVGDNNNTPAQNARRSYGFFAIPYGASGTYSTANLQAEGESGSLGTGWSSVADAAASGGNTAKAASGTLTGNADTFGTSFVPMAGFYDVWFRVKVTTNVGSAAEMTLGLWDATSGAFVPSGSTTFNRTAMSTSYAWVRAATGVTPTAAHNMQFRAVTALTLGTDWFIDEAILAPKNLSDAGSTSFFANGPQDLWSQFMYDRSVRLVRQ